MGLGVLLVALRGAIGLVPLGVDNERPLPSRTWSVLVAAIADASCLLKGLAGAQNASPFGPLVPRLTLVAFAGTTWYVLEPPCRTDTMPDDSFRGFGAVFRACAGAGGGPTSLNSGSYFVVAAAVVPPPSLVPGASSAS